jgi:adenylate cyclase, class 2
MSKTGTELEVKFYVSDLVALEKRLQSAGGVLLQPRQHEQNLRFDNRDGSLSRSHQVLRLRRDSQAHLTFKGPASDQDGARLRIELETVVDDFEMARQILEALGYQIIVMYEKYRAAYTLQDMVVTLDELPYGNFSEIEGTSGASIQAAAALLALNWEARIPDSYLKLFERLRIAKNLEFSHLSFEHFKDMQVSPADLGVRAA